MFKHIKARPLIVVFRTPNGNEWEESYSGIILDILKKDPTVYKIIDKETYEIIYSRREKNK